VCTACEIRSSIRFHERMIEAAGFFQMKGIGSSFQCAMNTPGSSVSHHLETRNACVMLWLGELRSLDQVVQSGADCPRLSQIGSPRSRPPRWLIS
jgi:hypothetical protein